DYIHRVLALKRQFGTRFVMTVHDLIPIYARETCDQDTAVVFEEFMRRARKHVDHILAVSNNTAMDIKRYTASLQIPEPPITVTKNGSSFTEFLPRESPGTIAAGELPERFVLFVATIEGRKNHQLILDMWRRMIEEGDDPPHLICVGRLGWKSIGFISTVVESGYLGGRVHLLREICDADLKMLYSRCLFTLCPSFYEGWGLPVGEALAMGKICVCSDRASLPEVAGEFGVYIDIDDRDGSLAVIRRLLSDSAERARLEAKIRRGYEPVTWHSVAKSVVAACQSAAGVDWQIPYPYTAIPYSTEISFGKLDRDVDGTGEAVLARIEGTRRGQFLGELLQEQNFLLGEEIRSDGFWAYPEDWGTWACHAGGDIVAALPPSDSQVFDVFLRLRVSGLLTDHPVALSANGRPVWSGLIGQGSRNLHFRVRKPTLGTSGWRLRIRAELALSAELRSQIAALDARVPTIGFERLVVVPENDLKARLDVLYGLLL
ncbi:MAG: glycosyltransferase family 4 protein, partial [Alphaproteobacteria bacterium]|nr:glycosyltransferase family 4 protein [Alphaproteobacteria bacterium]